MSKRNTGRLSFDIIKQGDEHDDNVDEEAVAGEKTMSPRCLVCGIRRTMRVPGESAEVNFDDF